MLPEFLKLLLNNHPESIPVRDSDEGSVPFHGACFRDRLSTVAYLLEVYPGSIRVRDDKDFIPIHEARTDGNRGFSTKTRP